MKKKILWKNVILETTINVCFFNHCFTEWSVARSALEPPEELNHNGRSESQQPDEMQTLPMTPAAAALPAQVNNVKYYGKTTSNVEDLKHLISCSGPLQY